MSPAEALEFARQADLRPYAVFWEAIAASRRKLSAREPMITGLHNVPAPDEYWSQIDLDMLRVREEMVDLRKEWGL